MRCLPWPDYYLHVLNVMCGGTALAAHMIVLHTSHLIALVNILLYLKHVWLYFNMYGCTSQQARHGVMLSPTVYLTTARNLSSTRLPPAPPVSCSRLVRARVSMLVRVMGASHW